MAPDSAVPSHVPQASQLPQPSKRQRPARKRAEQALAQPAEFKAPKTQV